MNLAFLQRESVLADASRVNWNSIGRRELEIIGCVVAAVLVLAFLVSHPALTIPALVLGGFVAYRLYRARQDRNWREQREATRQRELEEERARLKALGDFLALTPTQFETAVGDVLPAHGFHGIQVLGGSGDLAADILCFDSQEARVVVQCKRYAPGHRVGSKDMQLFVGMALLHHEADYGVFVTTSAFTQPAIELAEAHGIELVDGARLVELAATSGPPLPHLAVLPPPSA